MFLGGGSEASSPNTRTFYYKYVFPFQALGSHDAFPWAPRRNAFLEAVVAPSPALISTLPSKWPGAPGPQPPSPRNMQAECPQLYAPVGIDAGTLARSPRFGTDHRLARGRK